MNKKYFNIFDYLVTKNGKAKTITKEKKSWRFVYSMEQWLMLGVEFIILRSMIALNNEIKKRWKLHKFLYLNEKMKFDFSSIR